MAERTQQVLWMKHLYVCRILPRVVRTWAFFFFFLLQKKKPVPAVQNRQLAAYIHRHASGFLLPQSVSLAGAEHGRNAQH